MADIPEPIKRRMIADGLRAKAESFIEQRVDRYIEASHHGMIPHHHFAPASAECISLYTDGYFYSTVMVAQSVAEGISRFIAERNGIEFDKKMSGPRILDLLIEKRVISKEYRDAFGRLWERRNDVHHMKPTVDDIPFPDLAKRSIQDLAAIEQEVFAFTLSAGKIVPANPKYWDIRADGTAAVFLRLSP